MLKRSSWIKTLALGLCVTIAIPTHTGFWNDTWQKIQPYWQKLTTLIVGAGATVAAYFWLKRKQETKSEKQSDSTQITPVESSSSENQTPTPTIPSKNLTPPTSNKPTLNPQTQPITVAPAPFQSLAEPLLQPAPETPETPTLTNGATQQATKKSIRYQSYQDLLSADAIPQDFKQLIIKIFGQKAEKAYPLGQEYENLKSTVYVGLYTYNQNNEPKAWLLYIPYPYLFQIEKNTTTVHLIKDNKWHFTKYSNEITNGMKTHGKEVTRILANLQEYLAANAQELNRITTPNQNQHQLIIDTENHKNIYTATYTAQENQIPTLEYKKIAINLLEQPTQQIFNNSSDFFAAITNDMPSGDNDLTQQSKLNEEKQALKSFVEDKEKEIIFKQEQLQKAEEQKKLAERRQENLKAARGIIESLFGKKEKTTFIGIAKDIHHKVGHEYGNNEQSIFDIGEVNRFELEPSRFQSKPKNIYDPSLSIKTLNEYLQTFNGYKDFLTPKSRDLNDYISLSPNIANVISQENVKNLNLGTISAVKEALTKLIGQVDKAIDSTKKQIEYRKQLDAIKKDAAYINLFTAITDYNTAIATIRKTINEKITFNKQPLPAPEKIQEKILTLQNVKQTIRDAENKVETNRTSLQNIISQNYKALDFTKNIESEEAYQAYLTNKKSASTLIATAQQDIQKIIDEAKKANIEIEIQQ